METDNDPDQVRADYDRLAVAYADAFTGELAGKPLDRALLAVLADEVRGRGRVADLGCGPGHVGAHVAAHGIDVIGVDLSPAMIEQARRRYPSLAFTCGDLAAPPFADGALAGIVAFYAIVHLTRAQLAPAFRGWRRALAPGAPALLAFHVGDETLAPGELLGARVSIGWNFFALADVTSALAEADLTVELELVRAPYASEHPSRRGYVLARRPP
jgi:SAM-dependent methyltransferase